ncbi:MAG: ABC transporter permease [Fuerstiella sp.]
MMNAFYLATKSLWWAKGRAITIVMCLALTLWLPLTVRTVMQQFSDEIIQRAEVTPLIIGAKGSQIDLALHALYFESAAPDETQMAEVTYVRESGYATAIPLHLRYRTQRKNGAEGAPIVGTTVDYFQFRKLSLQSGQGLQIYGDCVVGQNVADRMQLTVGDKLLSAPRNAFNLVGDYPLKLNIKGILNRSRSPDDDAVFVHLDTAWIIDGIGHGHVAVENEEKEGLGTILPYTEITASNIDSFHFHGDRDQFPVSAVIAVPDSTRNQTLLLGRYASVRTEQAQCLKPTAVVQSLLSIVFRVEQLVWISSILATFVTTALVSLVVLLSIRLRAGEMQTLAKIGCSKGTLVAIVGTEIGLMIFAGIAVAMAASWATNLLIADSLRSLLF